MTPILHIRRNPYPLIFAGGNSAERHLSPTADPNPASTRASKAMTGRRRQMDQRADSVISRRPVSSSWGPVELRGMQWPAFTLIDGRCCSQSCRVEVWFARDAS